MKIACKGRATRSAAISRPNPDVNEDLEGSADRDRYEPLSVTAAATAAAAAAASSRVRCWLLKPHSIKNGDRSLQETSVRFISAIQMTHNCDGSYTSYKPIATQPAKAKDIKTCAQRSLNCTS